MKRLPRAAALLAVLLLSAPAAAQLSQDELVQQQMRDSGAERDRQSQAFALQMQQQQQESLATQQQLPALQDLHAEQRRELDRQQDEQRRAERTGDITWGPRLDPPRR